MHSKADEFALNKVKKPSVNTNCKFNYLQFAHFSILVRSHKTDTMLLYEALGKIGTHFSAHHQPVSSTEAASYEQCFRNQQMCGLARCRLHCRPTQQYLDVEEAEK